MFRTLFQFSHTFLITVIGLAGLLFLVTIHEIGHFIMCKLFNVGTPSFSIGFGPKLISRKIGDTEFSISAIPLGGYVEIAGNAELGQGEQKEAERDDEYSFKNKPFYQKFLIMIGGILFNILFAYLVSIAIFVFAPQSSVLAPFNAMPVLQAIEPDSSAQNAGLQPGDRIIAINNRAIGNDVISLSDELKKRPGETIELTIERGGGQTTSVSATLASKKIMSQEIGMLGVTFAPQEHFSLLESISKGIKLMNYYVIGTFKALGYMFVQRDMTGVAGPIAIVSATAQGISKGFSVFLLFLAIISINLAILNLLPLPIFDGGQILFFGIESAIGRSIPDKIRMIIHLASWILVFGLLIYVTFKDIVRLLAGFLPGNK